MNDRGLHDDSHAPPMAVKEPEPEQPTPAAEVMIELLKRVSALEEKVDDMERKIGLLEVTQFF